MATIVNARDVLLQAAATRVAGVTLSPNLQVSPDQVTGLGLVITGTKRVFLEASSQVFQVPSSGVANPSSITLTAKLQNLTNTPTLTILSGSVSPVPTFVGSTATVPYADMSTDTVTFRLTVTEDSETYTDDMTLVKVREGSNGVTAFLTNESHTVPGDWIGNVTNYEGAGGTFKVYQGINDISNLCTYSVQVNSSSVTTSINPTTGVYSVTGAYPTGSDVITVTYRATFGSLTFDKVFTMSKARSGTNGDDGLNVSNVFIYRRSATAPALPTTDVTYTFETGSLTGLTNSWSAAVPSGTSPLYVSTATAAAPGASDTIAATEWATPAIMAEHGINTATVYLYRRSASAPAVPSTTSTYTFATSVLTGHNNSWTQTIPTGTSPLYVTLATAASTATTDTIAASEWTTPQVLAQNGSNGTNGARGSMTFYVTLSGSTGTYSDSLATTTASVQGGPIMNDTVVQSNSSVGFSQTKFWTGTAWAIVNAVVDGNLLVSGTVGAQAVAANAIRTSHMFVVPPGTGMNLWYDPHYEDTAAWAWTSAFAITSKPISTTFDGQVGNKVMSNSGGSAAGAYGIRQVPVQIGKKYRISAWFYRGNTSNGVAYLRLHGSDIPTSTYSQIVVSTALENFTTPVSTWTKVEAEWTATVAFVSPVLLLNYGGTAGSYLAQGISIEEKLEGTLIVDGTIEAKHVQAGSITADKLLVAPSLAGSSLVTDPHFRDAISHWDYPTTEVSIIAGAPTGGNYLRSLSGQNVLVRSKQLIPLDRDKSYRLEVDFYGSGGASSAYLGVAWYDSAGQHIVSSTAAPAGWTNGSYSYFGLTGGSPSSGWTTYGATFGLGQTSAIPSTATYCAVVALMNNTSVSGVMHNITNVRLWQQADSVLIKDGAITATKITVTNLSAIKAVIGTLRTATSGARIEIKDNIIDGFYSNNALAFKISAT